MTDESKHERPENAPAMSGVAHDEELRSVLHQWQAPQPPESLDARLSAAYRNRIEGASLWKRMFTANVPVPVPLALAFILLFLVATVSALRTRSVPVDTGPALARTAQKTPAPAVIPNRTVTGAPGASKEAGDVSSILLQMDQQVIPVKTGSKYRLNATPKIYVGGFFNPSAER